MKLINLITNVSDDYTFDAMSDELLERLGFNSWDFDWCKYSEHHITLTCKLFMPVYDTDSWVGNGALYLGDKLVGMWECIGRKSDISFKWLDKESCQCVRNFINIFIDKEIEDDQEYLSEEELQEEHGEGFKLAFSSQLMNGQQCIMNHEAYDIKENRDNKTYCNDKVTLTSGNKVINTTLSEVTILWSVKNMKWED